MRNVIWLLVCQQDNGKSLVYDMLPHFSSRSKDAAVVIISPLRVIINDVLTRHGTRAYEVSKSSINDVRFKSGDFRYLVGFPECFVDKDMRQVMKTWLWKVEWIVIDEAHCILQWGTSFRPDYKNIEMFCHT